MTKDACRRSTWVCTYANTLPTHTTRCVCVCLCIRRRGAMGQMKTTFASNGAADVARPPDCHRHQLTFTNCDDARVSYGAHFGRTGTTGRSRRGGRRQLMDPLSERARSRDCRGTYGRPRRAHAETTTLTQTMRTCPFSRPIVRQRKSVREE